MEQGWNGNDRGKAEVLEKNPVPRSLFPQKKKRHGLVRKQTRASEVTGQKSTHRLIHGTALAVLSAVGPIFMKPVVLYQLDNAR